MPRASDYSRSFLKDWERLTRSGRYDMNLFKQVMMSLVANDGPLGPEFRDHDLKSNLSGYRECHIGGDFLLVYKIDKGQPESVIFVRAGTHSELFE